MCREIYPEEMWYALEKADSGRISQNASTKYAVPSRAQQYELVNDLHVSRIGEGARAGSRVLSRKHGRRLTIPILGGWG
jgi:hypothetical protein